MRPGMLLFLAALALAHLPGCAGRSVEDPALLRSAREAAAQFSEIWAPDMEGYSATIRPENQAFGEHNLVLQAIYKTEGREKAQFALFLPQGSKVGQCERVDGAVKCSAMPAPGAESLTRTAFTALDGIFWLKPTAQDQWDLRQGDGLSRIPMDRVLLRRQAERDGTKNVVLYETSGKLVAAYKQNRMTMDQSPLAWKVEFGDNPSQYGFKNMDNSTVLNVIITRYRIP